MTGDRFEYAIRKDVRNNPIVREIDRQRLREMWRSSLVGLFLVVVLLFAAWQNVLELQQGYRFDEMERARDEEAAANLRLVSEVQMLSAPSRIERYAIDELGMVAPDGGNSTVIERRSPPPPPGRSVVARR